MRLASAIQAANGANLVEGGGAARVHRSLLRREGARSRVSGAQIQQRSHEAQLETSRRPRARAWPEPSGAALSVMAICTLYGSAASSTRVTLLVRSSAVSGGAISSDSNEALKRAATCAASMCQRGCAAARLRTIQRARAGRRPKAALRAGRTMSGGRGRMALSIRAMEDCGAARRACGAA